MASQNWYILLLVIFASFPSVKEIGEDSRGSESASGINLPSFTYEIYINLPILERTLARERHFKVATYGVLPVVCEYLAKAEGDEESTSVAELPSFTTKL